MRQIGRRERRRVGFVIGAGVHTAYHEKQCARHVVTTAHLADRYVAERQLDVEAQKNRQKAVIGIYQLYDLHILREDRSIGSVTFHFPYRILHSEPHSGAIGRKSHAPSQQGVVNYRKQGIFPTSRLVRYGHHRGDAREI